MEIRKIFVVGSGLMGSGIAQSAPVWTVWWRRAR